MANCLSDLCTDNYNSLVPNNFELFFKLFSIAMCKVSTSRICQKKGLMMSMRCGEIETVVLPHTVLYNVCGYCYLNLANFIRVTTIKIRLIDMLS